MDVFWFWDLSRTRVFGAALQSSIFNEYSLPPPAAKLKGKLIPAPAAPFDEHILF